MSSFIDKLILWTEYIINKGGEAMSKGINLWSKGLSKLSPQKFEHYQEPIDRPSFCESSHSACGITGHHTAQVASSHSALGKGHTAYSVARNSLSIGLPSSSKDQRGPKIMEECVKKDMTAKELIGKLALKLRVNKDKWVLVVVSNEKTPYVLDAQEKVDKFITSKTERLYFYPEFVLRR